MYTRRPQLIVLLFLLVLVPNSCKKARLRMQYKELMANTITLPENIACVYKGEVFPMPDDLRKKPKLLVYADSTECTTCRISNIGRYHQFFQLSEEKGLFEVVLLFPNINLSGVSIERYLLDSDIWYPVFIDVENRYLELNPYADADQRLHALFIDEDGTPLYVGDPSSSREMLQVFLETVGKTTY